MIFIYIISNWISRKRFIDKPNKYDKQLLLDFLNGTFLVLNKGKLLICFCCSFKLSTKVFKYCYSPRSIILTIPLLDNIIFSGNLYELLIFIFIMKQFLLLFILLLKYIFQYLYFILITIFLSLILLCIHLQLQIIIQFS